MPKREEALAELGSVFEMTAAEYGEKGLSLPAGSTAIRKCLAPGVYTAPYSVPHRFRRALTHTSPGNEFRAYEIPYHR